MNDGENIPQLAGEYWSFVMWKCMPAFLRKKSEDELRELGFSEDMIDLVSIKGNKEFAERFDLGINTPTRWQKLERFHSDVSRVSDSMTVNVFKPMVNLSFTMKTIEHGDAARVKLWKQLYEGWVEREQIDTTPIGGESQSVKKTDLTNDTLMTVILGKAAEKAGIDPTQLLGQLRKKRLSSPNVIDAEIVDHEEFPSQQQYDFEKIEQAHRGTNGHSKEETIHTNGSMNGEEQSDLKKKLLAKLKESTNEATKKKVAEALKKRVKNKGKGKKDEGKS